MSKLNKNSQKATDISERENILAETMAEKLADMALKTTPLIENYQEVIKYLKKLKKNKYERA